MRRKDREITDKQAMLDILNRCSVCRLAMADGEQPYVVPLNFGYAWPENGPLTLYFHCARQGRKLDILAKNNRVCFEFDCDHALLPGKTPGDYSFAYASLIGFGRACIIDGAEEKRLALHKLLEHQAGPGEYEFSEAQVNGVTVFCVQADEVTGKSNIKG